MRGRWTWIKGNWKRLPHPFRWAVVATIGSSFLLVGLLGLIFPIIPGIPLIIAGLAILATEFAWAEVLLDQAKGKFSNVLKKMRKNLD